MPKNNDFTLISRDCIGGVLYHQLGLKFLSPTINLFFQPDDFNYFCLYLKNYINGRLVETKEKGINYPIGLLIPRKDSKNKKTIKVYFMHYDSFEVAKKKWNERKKRINYDNLYVISSICYEPEIKTISKELIDNWNKIKYKKVVIVNTKYGFDNEYVINKPKDIDEFAWLLSPKDKSNPDIKVFNEFDFNEFLK